MKNLTLFLLSLFVMKGFLFSPVFALESSEGSKAPDRVLRIEIRGTINPATAHYLERAIAEAEMMNASALLLELDTPGGLVSSTRDMAQAMDRSQVPLILFVAPAGASATSAGALLMIASHVAAMSPGTNIGAAHPVGTGGEDIQGASAEKAVNDVAAFARGLAELRGRSAEVASNVVSKSESFSAEEALKKKLIDVISPHREDLLSQLEGRQVKMGERTLTLDGISRAQVVNLEMGFGEKILHFLAHPNVAALLMSLGVLLIYAEVSTPGLGLPGVAGALCLMIAFIAFQAVPIREGALALLVFGVVLLVAEFFAATGGILALGGIVSFALGLLWLIDPNETDLRISPVIMTTSTLLLAIGGGVIGYAAARTRKLTQKALAETGGTGVFGLEGYEGVVQSLQPGGKSGKILIRGEIWSFRCGEELKVGDRVIVVNQEQFNLDVIPL